MPRPVCSDRPHAPQTKAVNVAKLIATNTIEQRILELQAEKWEMADQVLGEESGFGLAGGRRARRLTVQELMLLFNVRGRR
eukprot:SAG22_NODE_1693_length_3799_cov_2.227568_2_plen_81_part_00